MARPADEQGHALTATDAESADLWRHAVRGYLGARADARDRVDALLAADPRMVLGHCLDGYLHLLSSTSSALGSARTALARARGVGGATRREELHLAALGGWTEGDLEAAAGHWRTLLADYPRDLLAIRVSQFVLSYLGDSAGMRNVVRSVLPAWAEDTPGYGHLLGCLAYAEEETGGYRAAETAGLEAVRRDREDIWAAHAVAHVREMEGRWQEGMEWIADLAPAWVGCSNFGLHLRWHEALFHLELEQWDRAVALYDREVRAEPSDQVLDLTNAVSLLWRLEQEDVLVGSRWSELARTAGGHQDDHALVFADLHYLMAIAAAGDDQAVDRFLRSSEQFAGGTTTEARVMADVGLPLARGIVAHRQRRYGAAVDVVLPVRDQIRRIGGSHAQRDLFHRLLIDAAWRAGRLDTAAGLLADRVASRTRNLWGWRHYARVLEAQGSVEAGNARREHDRLASR
jgi:tetratricopeptide (TPR) repeat protein